MSRFVPDYIETEAHVDAFLTNCRADESWMTPDRSLFLNVSHELKHTDHPMKVLWTRCSRRSDAPGRCTGTFDISAEIDREDKIITICILQWM